MPNIDGNFINYGVTTDDLKTIEQLCTEKQVPYDMVLTLLQYYQQKKNEESTMNVNAFSKIVKRVIR